MPRARALLAPTTYLEPFGGVAVEAMLSGTPVISTDWVALTETVLQGATGCRCRTLADFLEVVEKVPNLSGAQILTYAAGRYTLNIGVMQYGEGWYSRP